MDNIFLNLIGIKYAVCVTLDLLIYQTYYKTACVADDPRADVDRGHLLPCHLRVRAMTMKQEQEALVAFLTERPQGAAIAELRAVLPLQTDPNIRTRLKALIEQGRVRHEGLTRATRYFASPAQEELRPAQLGDTSLSTQDFMQRNRLKYAQLLRPVFCTLIKQAVNISGVTDDTLRATIQAQLERRNLVLPNAGLLDVIAVLQHDAPQLHLGTIAYYDVTAAEFERWLGMQTPAA